MRDRCPGAETEAREAVKLLVELGADVSDVDEAGNTTFHGAAKKVVLQIVQGFGPAFCGSGDAIIVSANRRG